MSGESTPAGNRPLSGQTLFFLGDHTSPDDPGYVAVMREVIARFLPGLALNLISAGGRGQTASALRSEALMQLLTTSRPDWLVLGIGLGDGMREPEARRLLDEYRASQSGASPGEGDDGDAVGPEFGQNVKHNGRNHGTSTGDNPGEPVLRHIGRFGDDLLAALRALEAAGVRVCVLTTIIVANDPQNPVNRVLRAYNRTIRQAASETGALVADVEHAFRALFDRAANYKQSVNLTGSDGELNAQGNALVARTVLETLGLLRR